LGITEIIHWGSIRTTTSLYSECYVQVITGTKSISTNSTVQFKCHSVLNGLVHRVTTHCLTHGVATDLELGGITRLWITLLQICDIKTKSALNLQKLMDYVDYCFYWAMLPYQKVRIIT
jgi:hypothetical protein